MGDIADEAAHEDHDDAAAAIQRHHHTHLGHPPVQEHGHGDHLMLLLLAFQLYLWLFLQSPCRENDTTKAELL